MTPIIIKQPISDPQTPYTLYDVSASISTDNGERVLPVGQVNAPSQKVNLHSPVSHRTITFHLIRKGAQPVPPAPALLPGEVLQRTVIQPSVPLPTQDDDLFEIKGFYFIVQTKPMVLKTTA